MAHNSAEKYSNTETSAAAPTAQLGRVPDIGDRVKIWWPDDGAFYGGKVTRFNDQDNTHFIEYDDGETEFLDMKLERWVKILPNDNQNNNDDTKLEPKPENGAVPNNNNTPISNVNSVTATVDTPLTAKSSSVTPVVKPVAATDASPTVKPVATVPTTKPAEAVAKPMVVPPKKAAAVVGAGKQLAEPAMNVDSKPSESVVVPAKPSQPIPPTPSTTTVAHNPGAGTTLEMVPSDVPRYKLQPRHANGKFGALPPELKVAAQRSKTGDPGASTSAGAAASKSRMSNAVRTPGQPGTGVVAGSRAVVSGPHVTRRPSAADPNKVVSAQQSMYATNAAALKRNAPLPAGRTLVAPSKSVGCHTAEVPKKKMRMSGPSSAQVARSVTTPGRLPHGASVPTAAPVNPVYTANVVKGRPAAQRPGAVNVARPNQRTTKNTSMAGVTMAVGNNPEASKTVEDMVLDTKNELMKVQRGVTLLHSMQRDLTKQIRVDASEEIRRQSNLQNEMERLRMDVRRLLDGQSDLMIAMNNLQERMDVGPRGYQQPSTRQPYQQSQYRSQFRTGAYPRGEFYEPPGRYAGEWERGRDRPVVAHPGRRVSTDRVPQSESIVAQVKGDILALTAKQVMIWLLETDHECRSEDTVVWAQVETTKCMERVAYLLGKFTEYAHALRVLTDSLGLDSGQLLWFTDGASAENLRMARQNYDVWDPPPTDMEWVKEVKLLVEVEKRFKVALGNYEISVNETTLAACISVANAAAAAVPIVRTSNGAKGRPKPPNGGQPAQETAADIVAAAGTVQQPPTQVAQVVQQVGAEACAAEGNTIPAAGQAIANVAMETGYAATPNTNGAM